MADERKGYFATGKISPVGPGDAAELVVLARHAKEDAARAQAVALVEAGIGAHVAEEPGQVPHAVDVDDAADPWVVKVLRVDADRGRLVLGLPSGDGTDADLDVDVGGEPISDEEAERLRRKASDRAVVKRILLVFAIALLTIPPAAFYLTLKLLGGNCPSGPAVPVSVIMTTRC